MDYSKTFSHLFYKTTSNSSRRSWKMVRKNYKPYRKTYKKIKPLQLPKPKKLQTSLGECLVNRTSTRNFSKVALSNQIISNLLYYSTGIIRKTKQYSFTTYPSSGGLYPIGTYIFCNERVVDSKLQNMLCFYDVHAHSLVPLIKSTNKAVKELLLPINQPMIEECNCVIFLTAYFGGDFFAKYKERSMRFALQETGHIGQNIYLSTQAMNLGCCALGGYYDDDVDNFLGTASSEEYPLYLFAVGTLE